MRFQPLTEHQLLVLWVQLAVLLVTARGLGTLMRRVGQPPVIGELAAGVVLGPSVLGWIAPGLWAWLFPEDAVHAGLMAGVGWIGVFMLLVLAGVETDLGLVRRLGRAAALVSTGSLVVPLAAGATVGLAMPERFLGRADDALGFPLFMATALSISSLPVVAKVLTDLDLVRRNFGQLTLAAGMANDVVGWILLGLVSGLVTSGALEWTRLALALGGLAVLAPASLTIGQRGVDAALRAVRQRAGGLGEGLTVVVLVALAGAVLTQAIGLEGVLGAFVAGILLGRSKFHDPDVVQVLEHVTAGVFAPIFFARAGLQVDLALLADPVVVGWSAVVLAAASGSKFLGAWMGARAAGLLGREGLALGAGLNARGALEIVVATVGLGLGVLNAASYTAVVIMAIATSMLAPVMLRAIVRGWHGSPEEQARLERERVLGRNALVRPVRALLPSHGGPNSLLAARILDLAWPEGVEVTVLSVGRPLPGGELERLRAELASRPVEHVHRPDGDVLTAVLDEARLGYGAIAVGATDRQRDGRLLSPLVDELLAASPLPVIIVRQGLAGVGEGFGRILVPAVGTVTGRAAQEVAFGLAQRLGTEVMLTHVVPAPRSWVATALRPLRRGLEAGVDEGRMDVAVRVLEEARTLAAETGVRATTVMRVGRSAAEELLALSREARVDCLVVTANVRQLSGRPFLGHGTEHLLEHGDCTLVVVATPPGWAVAAGRAAPAPAAASVASEA